MPTNGQPQPPAPRPPQPVRPQPRHSLHPEAENLAYGYSDLLMELDNARAKIASCGVNWRRSGANGCTGKTSCDKSGNARQQCWIRGCFLIQKWDRRRPPADDIPWGAVALVLAVATILILLIGCTVPLRT